MPNPMMDALQQLQQMQHRIAETQARVEQMTVTEEINSGLIRVTANGAGHVTKLEVKPEAIDPADREGLEDLLIAAVNKALDSAKEMAARELESVTQGMMPNIPGLNLPF